MSTGVSIAKRCAHGVHRNPRDEPGEKESADTNPDCKDARECLPRYEIAITNRKSGNEGEIDRVAHTPAFKKADQKAEGNLNR
jgi:hypothetical protein